MISQGIATEGIAATLPSLSIATLGYEHPTTSSPIGRPNVLALHESVGAVVAIGRTLTAPHEAVVLTIGKETGEIVVPGPPIAHELVLVVRADRDVAVARDVNVLVGIGDDIVIEYEPAHLTVGRGEAVVVYHESETEIVLLEHD